MISKLSYGHDGDHVMCIYKLANKLNGKIYIGQTIKKARRRWTSHAQKYSGVSCINRAIHKYGKENFTYEVIDIAEDTESLGHKEKFWISHYNSQVPTGYNIQSGGVFKSARSEDFKKQMVVLQSNIHGTKRSRGYVTRNRTPEEAVEAKRLTRERQSLAKQGKPSHMRGKSHSDETKSKISASKTGVEVLKLRKRVIRNDGIVFDSIKSAANFINVHPSGVQSVLSGRSKTTGGYSFKYYEEKEH